MDDVVIEILKKCGLVTESLDDIHGQCLPREIFLSTTKYEEVKEDIKGLKKYLCSSSYTSLHKNADLKQNWPLLNLVRQILKMYNFSMRPYKKSDGYSKDGKKLFRRFFIIEKINSEKPKDV